MAKIVDAPQSVKNAMGTLVLYAQGQDFCKTPGDAFWMTMIPMTMGDVPMGSWKITIERLHEPD